MKIHYKTILVKKALQELYGTEQYFMLYEKNHRSEPVIDYCCDTMKLAIAQNVLYQQEVGNNEETNNILGMCVYDNGEGPSPWYHYKLNFCPWCGEKIELIEDYRAKEVTYNFKVKAKRIFLLSELKNELKK